MIKVENTNIPDLKILIPQCFKDDRGFFYESFNENEFHLNVSKDVVFIQDNHSSSSAGVLRGLHYQKPPYEQAKLVRVISGEIFDVAVDLRKDSKTFGLWVGVILSESNKKQLWIPKGFAHGFVALSDNSQVLYKTDNNYCKSAEVSIKWNDDDINIQWPNIKSKFIISEKDSEAMGFKEFMKSSYSI